MRFKIKLKNLKGSVFSFKKDGEYDIWQKRLFIFGLPLIAVCWVTYVCLNPEIPFKSVMMISSIGLCGYIILVSMIRKSFKNFWIIFLSIFIAYGILFYPDFKEHQYSYILIIAMLIASSVLFILCYKYFLNREK